jgi:uroporphyrinogen-III synthase
MTRPSVVLTQPALRAVVLAESLRDRGFELASWPMTAIAEVAGLDWPALSVTLAGCRWVLLPSPGAIEVVMSALEQRGLAWPRAAGVGVIGPGSREALERWRARLAGLDAVPVLEPRRAPYDADALLAEPEFASLSGVDVAVLRRADGREAWLQTLRARGARLHAVSVYTAHEAMPPTRWAGWSIRSGPGRHSLAAWRPGWRSSVSGCSCTTTLPRTRTSRGGWVRSWEFRCR